MNAYLLCASLFFYTFTRTNSKPMINKLTVVLCLGAFLLLASCGNDDMVNGAKVHGETMGAKKCECASIELEAAMKCIEELNSMNENYKTFLETADGEGSDMTELKNVFNDAHTKASADCK